MPLHPSAASSYGFSLFLIGGGTQHLSTSPLLTMDRIRCLYASFYIVAEVALAVWTMTLGFGLLRGCTPPHMAWLALGAVAWGATSKLAFSLMLDLNVDARMATNLSSST